MRNRRPGTMSARIRANGLPALTCFTIFYAEEPMPDLSLQSNPCGLPKIVAIVGATAVGKTDLSIDIAGRFGGEIVNVDSRLFYRGMDIGTAKPTPEQMARVRHHLIDFLHPNDPVSLATVQDLAYSTIDEIVARGVLPILVGGTPQYVNAIVENWRIPRVEPNPELRARLEAEEAREAGTLLARLVEVDPEAARKHAGNTRRVIRALEVFEATGMPITTLQGKNQPRYDALELELWRPRDELYERIDDRVAMQFEQGLEKEVRSLLDSGVDPLAGSFASIGYRQLVPYIRGECSREDAMERVRLDSHRLVRHQDTWWRKNPRLVRIDLTQPGATTELVDRIASFLGNP